MKRSRLESATFFERKIIECRSAVGSFAIDLKEKMLLQCHANLTLHKESLHETKRYSEMVR